MNENLDSVTHDELKEAFLNLMTQKIHAVLFPVLFPAQLPDLKIMEEYNNITSQIAREAAERFFELVARGEKP